MSMWLFSPDTERGAEYHRATSPHVPAYGSVDYLKVYIAPSLWELHDDGYFSELIEWTLGEYVDGGILPYKRGVMVIDIDFMSIGASMTMSFDDMSRTGRKNE